MDVQTYLILAELQRSMGAATVDTLSRARDMQKSAVNESRVLRSSTEAIEAERLVLSVLCEQLGAALTSQGDYTEAETCLNEALSTNPHNAAALFSLAELSRLKGDEERVKSLCNKIILADPAHEAATVMLSDRLRFVVFVVFCPHLSLLFYSHMTYIQY
jgi:tetratricopeptide (TPR) repeat protein